MWIVCETCGKKVCNDYNLYRHRCDTSKSQCKKCINCDVPITSRRQIRTHMKLNHRDFPCGTETCEKKFYLATGRDQHKRDVHGGQTSVLKDKEQHKQNAHVGGSCIPREQDQHKREAQIVATSISREQDQHKREAQTVATSISREQDQLKPFAHIGGDTLLRDQDQNKPDDHIGEISILREQDQDKQYAHQDKPYTHVGITSMPREHDQHKAYAHVCGTSMSREQDHHKPYAHIGGTSMSREQNHHKPYAHIDGTSMSREQDHHKSYAHIGGTSMSREQDQHKAYAHNDEKNMQREQYQHKRDAHNGKASVPEEQNLQKPDANIGKTTFPRGQTQTSLKKLPETIVHGPEDVPKQPKYNTRFLTDLKLSGNNLKRLLDEKVRQDPDKMRRCKEIVHHLVNFMQHNLDFGVSEVVKGGSLGKGTSIREKVDIDLVVFMNRFKSVADLQENHEEVIKVLKKHILEEFTFAKQLHYSYDTKHSNRFSLRTDDGKGLIQVDLLPACDIGRGSTSTFEEMAGLSEEAKSYYSVSFVKDQVRFTKDKPESVKDVIRLVKHWKTREKLNISSYTVEIITIREWERMGSPGEADLNQLFRRTMTELSDMDNINITWSNSRYTGNRLTVMVPANPFNNTASLIKRSDQENIEIKAQEVVSWLNAYLT